MEKYYKIAGLNVKMDTFGMTEAQAEAYRLPEPCQPDVEIHADFTRYQAVYPKASDEISEYMTTGADFYKRLLDFDGLMLHSSAVVVDHRAYLFTANSGTGKSTHTQLWLQQFGDRAYILNDDKPALRLREGRWYAYGTPWSGKVDLSRNVEVPLGGIAALERDETNSIEPFSGLEAIRAILAQVARPKAAQCREKVLVLLDKLLTMVPVWRLRCNMEPEAVAVSYEAMSGEKIQGGNHL